MLLAVADAIEVRADEAAELVVRGDGRKDSADRLMLHKPRECRAILWRREITPVRGDFLVEDAVPANWSPRGIFPANREKNREIFGSRPIFRKSPLDLLVIS
jgi:hypothetical protein